jgi:Fe2+ or Zn2+ uptake regulation protein
MCYHIASSFYEILDVYKIKATSIRVEVLRAIYSIETEFTADQILDKLKEDIPVVKRDTVVSVLRLYKVRGLLTSAEYPTSKPGGRPIVKFKIKYTHE